MHCISERHFSVGGNLIMLGRCIVNEVIQFVSWLGTLCCVLGQDTTQVYKWIPVNLLLAGNPAMK